ncbi:MAG: hypothetical protein IAG13_17135 [Deltaproteobacteria bacterium]|nr:hypothetical protein [Nannocystaceae bacterium]
MNEPHCAERHDDMLRKVVDIESITALTGHCRAVVWAPERFGFAPGGIDVAIPPASAPLKRPKPTTARAINERFVRVHRVPSEQALFTGNELAAMTKSSFDNPTFRSGYVYDEARRDVRRKSGLLTMLVVYSPESSKVYVFEKRYPDRSDADLATRDARIRHDADAFLRSLGLASMRFPVELACEIPEELGGKEWYPIRLEP